MKKLFYFSSVAVVLLLMGAGCSSNYYGTPSANTPAPAVPGNLPPENTPANTPIVTPPIVNNVPVPPAPGRNTSAKTDVSISNFSFAPANVTIKKGMTVVWTNNDSVGHTVTADTGSDPASSLLNPGDTFAYTFSEAGTFNYHCSIHKSMQGTVTVTP